MGPQSSTWQFCDRALFGMVKWPKLRLSDLMEIIPLLGGHHHFHWFSGHVFKLRTTSRCPSLKFEKISKNLLMKLEKIIFPNQNFLSKNWEKNSPTPRPLAWWFHDYEGPDFLPGRFPSVPRCPPSTFPHPRGWIRTIYFVKAANIRGNLPKIHSTAGMFNEIQVKFLMPSFLEVLWLFVWFKKSFHQIQDD